MAKKINQFDNKEIAITVILFILGILPGILYLLYKTQWQK